MATGTPVIARRAGALPEIIEHGRSGFLVDDLQEAVLAVERASAVDRRLVRRSTLGQFSVERMLDEYEAVYRDLASLRLPTRFEAKPFHAVMGDDRAGRNRAHANGHLEPVAGTEGRR